MIDSLLLTSVSIFTYDQQRPLTNATGFFFESNGRLFLVTSLHVVSDALSKHYPDQLVIEFHTSEDNIAETVTFSIPLYSFGSSVWRAATDSAGSVDVAVIELDRAALPPSTVYRAFTPEHVVYPSTPVEIGTSLLIVGFPLGFHDTLHHIPVVRHAVLASSFGLRFQGMGYFLTDARTHRGASGAPVVMRADDDVKNELGDLPWRLLGVHSARLDMGNREIGEDEALGLNSAWYMDFLPTLTEAP